MAIVSKNFRVKNGLYVENSGAGSTTIAEFASAGLVMTSAAGVLSSSITPTGITSINGTSIPSSATLLISTNIGSGGGGNAVQAWDGDLDAIAALAGTAGFLKKTAANAWSLDTNTYLVSSAAAASVANSLIIKADSGTTEGTDLYTFNGSTAKTLNLVGGTGITIAKVAGQWTINGSGTGVTDVSFGTMGFTPSTATSGSISVAGTLVAANGGTGFNTYAIGDILYASTTTALSKLAGVATGNVLISGGVTTAPSWGKVGLTTHISGTLAIGNGGTGSTDGSITGTGALTYTAGGTNTNINLVPNGTGTVDVASKRITAVATPTAATDAANKQYVDDARTGLDAKQSVRVASAGANVTVTYTAAGGTSARGQITAAPNTLDGVTLVANDRILLKDQTAGAQNGIWVVSTLGTGANGVWDRATDFDTDAEVTSGAYVWIEEGTTNLDSAWVLTTNNPIIIGGASGTALVWALFSNSGTLVAGAGLVKNANAIDVGTASSSRIVVNADNIDLATVSQSGAAGTGGINFLQSVTVDSYGRVTAQTASNVQDATNSGTKGVASFTNTQFTVATGAVSLTSLAGSVINSGVVGATYGGTGVNNGSNTITLAGNVSTAGAFTTAGAFGLTLTTTALTSVTLPTTGTLATLAGAESLTNKKLGSLTSNGLVTTSGGDGTLSVTVPGTGILTFLATPSSANLSSALTDKTGTGVNVFAGSPALTGIPTVNARTGIATGSGTTTGTTPMSITFDSTIAVATYDGAEVIVKIKNGTNREIVKILLTTDGTTLWGTQYADVISNTSLIAASSGIDFGITTGNLTMTVTPIAGATGTTSAVVELTLLAV